MSDWDFLEAASYRRGRRGDKPVCGVVQHYTAAGRGRALARWLASNDKSVKVSAHIIICRDGHVIQQVKFSDTAFHAGEKMSKGRWKGHPQPSNVNDFTIGIENSNYGKLIEDDGVFTTAHGIKYRGPTPVEADGHWWEPYSSELIDANIGVIRAIIKEFPLVTRANICGHSDVSPHRKIDPGPLFPSERILDAVFGVDGMSTEDGQCSPQ